VHITLFSFGYWGWGTATDQLVKAVDAVERSRGFKPPIFVDTRIQRSVRAPGFNGRTFEEKLGPRRHRWLPGLGNKRIQSGKGKAIQIADPAEAQTLRDLALEAADGNRRIIFFCNCPWAVDGRKRCHRTEIASLLLKAANRRDESLTIAEWPGGEPESLDLSIDEKAFKRLLGEGWYIPVPQGRSLSDCSGLAWGSRVNVWNGDDFVQAVVGPAVWRQGQWQIPVFYKDTDGAMTAKEFQRQGNLFRREHGCLPRSCQ
jgi:hypothetical protein